MKKTNMSLGWVIIIVLVIVGVVAVLVYPTVKTNMLAEMGQMMADEETMMKDDLEHGIVVMVDGEAYYFDGPADGVNGAKDIPGHYWKMNSKNTLTGLHYNSGPEGAAKFWSSDADDGALLYRVDAIIDGWTEAKAKMYADEGFVHYHELVSAATGERHPNKVVWLRHNAVISFNLNGAVVGEFAHRVQPGIDLGFPPNGMTPYTP